MENEEKRMISSYEVIQSIHIGKKEVVFGIDEKEEYPFLVCDCTYDNPLSSEWVTDAVGSDDYLEAMQIFTDRVQEQIGLVRAEQEQFKFDMTPFTIDDCIPDNKNDSIVGKVVAINAEVNRYEYRHSAYQLVLVDGGHGARGGRGQAVFGTSLADGKPFLKSRNRKRRKKQRVGRNADGDTSFDAARTEIHLCPEYAA